MRRAEPGPGLGAAAGAAAEPEQEQEEEAAAEEEQQEEEAGGGNWPCHVSVPVMPPVPRTVRERWLRVLRALPRDGSDGCWEELGGAEEDQEGCATAQPLQQRQHVSLSHTFCLRRHEITPFRERLQQELTGIKSFRMLVSGTPVVFGNERRTRAFLALRASSSVQPMTPAGPERQHHGRQQGHGQGLGQGLNGLVAAVNRALHAFGKPPYFAQPEFHVSIATCATLRSPSAIAAQLAEARREAQSSAATTTVGKRKCREPDVTSTHVSARPRRAPPSTAPTYSMFTLAGDDEDSDSACDDGVVGDDSKGEEDNEIEGGDNEADAGPVHTIRVDRVMCTCGTCHVSYAPLGRT